MQQYVLQPSPFILVSVQKKDGNPTLDYLRGFSFKRCLTIFPFKKFGDKLLKPSPAFFLPFL